MTLSDDYGQPITPDGSARVTLAEMGMPSAFMVGIRQYGHDYFAALAEAACVMRMGMKGGRDPVNGSIYHEPADPCDLLQSIILSTMQRMEGQVEYRPNPLPMEETERKGKGVTRLDQIKDILADFLEAVGDDLQTGEGLCFCIDGAWSERAIARAANRIDALFPDSRFREGLVGIEAGH